MSDKIARLAIDYVLGMSRSKKFNPQAIANIRSSNDFEKDIILLNMSAIQFCNIVEFHKVKDFIYKNDYFTPRRMFIISPTYYVYYTTLVFRIAEKYLSKKTAKLDFSKDRVNVFYSGLLDLAPLKKNIAKRAQFNESYRRFQKKREKYFGFPVLKIDIQDFFHSIKTVELIRKLRVLLGNDKMIDDLEYFFRYCEFDSLPQLHYSIASSILAQFYLMDFDARMQSILFRDNLHLIRFVDDMYIIHLDGVESIKRNNNLLNEISYFLWEDSLVLNTNKTKILSIEEYKEDYELVKSNYIDQTPYSAEKLIDKKAQEALNNEELAELIEKLCELEKNNGIDLLEYSKLMKFYLSIDGEEVGKVLNNIIYSGKWRGLENDKLIKIVDNWRYILFNPTQFTVLFLLVYRFLEKQKALNDNGQKVNQILNYLFKENIFTFRDTLVAISYLFQSSFDNEDLLNKVREVSNEYVEFIERFILE